MNSLATDYHKKAIKFPPIFEGGGQMPWWRWAVSTKNPSIILQHANIAYIHLLFENISSDKGM
jgi:hypothetical protein